MCELSKDASHGKRVSFWKMREFFENVQVLEKEQVSGKCLIFWKMHKSWKKIIFKNCTIFK
jgi:hypothetical protein